jgi:hypothetical protein
LCHHITPFSLYEFCLAKVFSFKVFNEVISTKLYASSLIFPTWVFIHDDYKHIFFWKLSEIILIIQRILYTPYFSHRVFEEIKNLMTDCKWSNGLGLIKGECYKIFCTCDLIHPCDSYFPRDTPLGNSCIYTLLHCNKELSLSFVSVLSICHWALQ